MKVVHVVLSLDVGGLERNVVNQVRVGPELGQELAIICIQRPGTLAPRAEVLGARVFCIHKRPGVRLGTIRRIKAILHNLNPDVVHTHEIGSLFYAGPAARTAGVPLVVHTEHGRAGYEARFRLRVLGRLAGRYADRFFCLTEDMAAAVVAQRIVPGAKVRVIANGIDVASFREPCDIRAIRRSLGIPLDAPLIGTVGRLAEIKRQDLLILAFANVKSRIPDAHLLLVGDGPLLHELTNLVGDLGLGDHVHFAGYQPHAAPYLQAMDVFALTSRSEGMPQALLEAAVIGVPIVASRVGGIPEVIESGRTGLLIEPGDEAGLTTALCEVCANPERAQEMSAAAQDRVISKYGIARMAAEYHKHFVELLAKSNLGTWNENGGRCPGGGEASTGGSGPKPALAQDLASPPPQSPAPGRRGGSGGPTTTFVP